MSWAHTGRGKRRTMLPTCKRKWRSFIVLTHHSHRSTHGGGEGLINPLIHFALVATFLHWWTWALGKCIYLLLIQELDNQMPSYLYIILTHIFTFWLNHIFFIVSLFKRLSLFKFTGSHVIDHSRSSFFSMSLNHVVLFKKCSFKSIQCNPPPPPSLTKKGFVLNI